MEDQSGHHPNAKHRRGHYQAEPYRGHGLYAANSKTTVNSLERQRDSWIAVNRGGGSSSRGGAQRSHRFDPSGHPIAGME
jgi:hypothetical protein